MFWEAFLTASTPQYVPCSQKGFTLLEVLISFTLVSIILTMMYSGMRIVYRATEAGEIQVSATSQVRSTQSFLRRQLSALLPIGFDTELDKSLIIFRGEPQKIEFVAPMPGHLRRGGLYKQTIELVDDDLQSALVFLFEPVNLAQNTAIELPEPVTLLAVKDVQFYYWENTGENTLEVDRRDWLEEWEDPARLPALIRIEVEFIEASKAFWPSLVIAPIRYEHK